MFAYGLVCCYFKGLGLVFSYVKLGVDLGPEFNISDIYCTPPFYSAFGLVVGDLVAGGLPPCHTPPVYSASGLEEEEEEEGGGGGGASPFGPF